MSYLTFRGSSALSDFRRKALVSKLDVKDVRAQWVHFVALHRSDGTIDYDKYNLDELLSYGDDFVEDEEGEENTTTWIVQPRKGTISPWSSKATSIAEACGLGHIIKRIERGTIVKIRSDRDFDVEKAKAELHDKMTQHLGEDMPDLEVMFGEQYVRLGASSVVRISYSLGTAHPLLQRLSTSLSKTAILTTFFEKPTK